MSKLDQRFNEYCMRIGKVLNGQQQISYMVGWVECRQEVLKLIKEYTYQAENHQGDRYDSITNIADFTKDIEKL